MNFLITGPWGIGKTSILKLVEKQLDNLSITWLEFSPWKYSSSDSASSAISRAFLSVLAEKLGMNHCIDDLYVSRRYDQQRNPISQIILWVTFLLTVTLYLYIFILLGSSIIQNVPILSFLKPISDYLLDNHESLGARIGLFLSVFGVVALPKLGEFFAQSVRQEVQVDKAFSPEQMETVFKNILNNSIRFSSLQKIIGWWEATVRGTILSPFGSPLVHVFMSSRLMRNFRLSKLIVFIDDLDRCNAAEVNEFLVGMKTFFNNDKVYFVLAADLSKLRELSAEHIGKDNLNDVAEVGTDFLRKIIQIDWSVPYPRKIQIESLINDLCERLNINPNTFNIGQIVHYSQYNPIPRRVKYYFRRLLFLMNIYRRYYKDSTGLNEFSITLLYKFIIIADLNPNAFAILASDPSLYGMIEDGEEAGWKEVLSGLKMDNPDVNLRKIRNIISEYPHIEESDIRLSVVLDLVGATEGRVTDTTEFIELASTDPQRAFQFFKHVLWNFTSLTNVLIADIGQNMGKIVAPDFEQQPQEQRDSIVDSTASQLDTLARIIVTIKKQGVKVSQDIFTKSDDLTKKVFELIMGYGVPIFMRRFWNATDCRINLLEAAYLSDRSQDVSAASTFLKEVQLSLGDINQIRTYIESVKDTIHLDDKDNIPLLSKIVEQLPLNPPEYLTLLSDYGLLRTELAENLQKLLIDLLEVTPDKGVRDSVSNFLTNNAQYLTPTSRTRFAEITLRLGDAERWKIMASNDLMRKSMVNSSEVINTLDRLDFNDMNAVFYFILIWKNDLLVNISRRKQQFEAMVSSIMRRVGALGPGVNRDKSIQAVLDYNLRLGDLPYDCRKIYTDSLKGYVYQSSLTAERRKISRYINSFMRGK